MTDNMLKYKNFYGSVQYSHNDECFYGKLVGITDLVTFEGNSVSNLKEAFVDAVEDYLALCAKVGKEPNKPYKGSFNVRISPELHQKATLLAQTKGVSLNSFVEDAIFSKVNA